MSHASRQVLEDDEYARRISQIIERDYFPYQKSLRAKNKALSQISASPSNASLSDKAFDKSLLLEATPSDKARPAGNGDKKSLNAFCAQNISADELAFETIQTADQKKHRNKFWWLKESSQLKLDGETNGLLQLEDEDGVVAMKNSEGKRQLMQTSRKNSLMFAPAQIYSNTSLSLNSSFTCDSKNSKGKEKVLLSENTRFKRPCRRVKTEFSRRSKAAESPGVNGFQYVASTPSINPSEVPASPMVTWGDLEGTPLRLEEDEAMGVSVKAYRMFETPRREGIHRSLANALRERSKGSSTPCKGDGAFSPAARKLMEFRSNCLSSMRSDLRRSYGNTPIRKSKFNKRRGAFESLKSPRDESAIRRVN